MATKKNKYTSIDLSKYDKGYQASKDVIKAQQNKTNAQNAVANYGDFAYKNQDAYDRALDAITNRKKFTYDLNADAMYQQYKDNYITQGKQAMMDTMGQASALTGGYGNSYAATVGNQTYQGYLTHLNDVAPELYKLALDKYNNEGNDLLNQLNVLANDRQTQYGEWGDKLNRLLADRDYHSSEYDAAYSRDYNAWNDNRSYDTSQYWNEYNAGYQAEQDAIQLAYQKERDRIADAQWQKEFDLAQKKYQASLNTGSSVVKTTNKPVVDTSEVPEGVINNLDSMSSNGAISEYLNRLVAAGTITEEQSKSLYAQYRIDMGDYELAEDGGINWFGGVDGNAKYRVYNHNTGKYETLTGDQLVKRVGEEEALRIQKHLGA